MTDYSQPQYVGPGNYYGRLALLFEDNQWYWSVENYDGYGWEPIPEYLAKALIKHNKGSK